MLQSLIETGTVSRGFLGVLTQTSPAEDAETLGLPKGSRGIVITDVIPNSPADKAGLKRGDVFITLNGRKLTTGEELRLIIAETMPGTKLKLGLSRGGKPVTVEVMLTKLDEKPDELIPGVDVVPLTDELRARFRIPARFDGLMIRAVDKDSPYAEALAPDVLIVQIDREDVTDLASAKAALTPGRHLLYVFYRGALRVVRIDVKAG